MAFLRDEDKKEIRKKLDEMSGKVKMMFFTQELDCQYCKETGQLLDELADLDDRLEVEAVNLVTDKEIAEQFKIDKAPAIVLVGEDGKDRGIRFFGIPSGYEFATLLEDILMVSANDSGLSGEAKQFLSTLDKDLHLQVFVTPTCPYCPGSVRIAHQLAFESDRVLGDMVEATEFPEMAQQYRVQGVPRTVVNETIHFECMQPMEMVLSELKKAV